MNPRKVPYHKYTKRIKESMRSDFYRFMPQDKKQLSPAEQFDLTHKEWRSSSDREW